MRGSRHGRIAIDGLSGLDADFGRRFLKSQASLQCLCWESERRCCGRMVDDERGDGRR